MTHELLHSHALLVAPGLPEEGQLVRRFTVRESLSTPFMVQVSVSLEDPAFDPLQVVGLSAGFFVVNMTPDCSVRGWNGVISDLTQLSFEPDGVSGYRFTLRPILWLLGMRTNNRIFQRKSLLDIVLAIFGEWDIAPELRLTEEYDKIDYVVQYGETDLAFVTRLLQRAGISYFFDHADVGDTKVVLSDAPQLAPLRPAAPQVVKGVIGNAPGELATKVRLSEALRPGAHTIIGYDFRQPSRQVKGEAPPVEGSEGFYEQVAFRPGWADRVDVVGGGDTPMADAKGVVRHDDASALKEATNALDGARASRRMVSFVHNCVDIAPGVVMKLEGHGRADVGEPLLIASTTLTGRHDRVWSYEAHGCFASETVRPSRAMPAPRIYGTQSAMVVGPKGNDIHTDEFGRVRVHFPWERDDACDDNSSCWIRVSHQWAGSSFGAIMIPRVGQEVLVAFLGGDPEQPIIVGRVYNGAHPTPYTLPINKTKSTWRSSTLPGSGGCNEITFDDQAGAEFVFHQAERDYQRITKCAETERVGQDKVSVIGRNRLAVVGTVDAAMAGGRFVREMVAPQSADEMQILKQGKPAVKPTTTAIDVTEGHIVFSTGKATLSFEKGCIAIEAQGNIVIQAHGKDIVFDGVRTFITSLTPPKAPEAEAIDKGESGTETATSAKEHGHG